MTNQTIRRIRSQQALTPDKPFFTYFATGATHAPHHVPKEWIDRFRGKFDAGWDKYREETFARQKKLGLIPEDTKLAARPATSRPGPRSAPTRSGCSPGRWRCSPPSPRTPTTRSAAS